MAAVAYTKNLRCAPAAGLSPRLLNLIPSLPCEPLVIHQVVNEKKEFSRLFNPEFPLEIRHYSFPKYRQMLGPNWLNWHAHLELIFPLAGAGRLRVGTQAVDFEPGDLLLIENFSLHGIESLKSTHQSLVIYFTTEFITRHDGLPCDLALLSPFFARPQKAEPILR